MRPVVIATLLFACLLSACKGERNEGKLMPKLAPPPRAAVPANLHIAVAADGVEQAAIVAQTLESTAPDFADDERRAWRLETLIHAATPGAPAGATTLFAVTGDRGVTVELRIPADGKGPVPALLMSRRGDIMATMVDPAAPFPPFHGQGGRLGRPGDTLPRIANVSRIALEHK